MMDREDDAVPLPERHHFNARLLARSLLREHEFTAREVVSWHRQEEGDLQREDMLAIEILMQAVVIALAIVQEERRWPGLAGAVTPLKKYRMLSRIAHVDAQSLVPAICDVGQRRIQRIAQAGDHCGQRIGKVLVLAASETVTRHHNTAAKQLVLGITFR